MSRNDRHRRHLDVLGGHHREAQPLLHAWPRPWSPAASRSPPAAATQHRHRTRQALGARRSGGGSASAGRQPQRRRLDRPAGRHAGLATPSTRPTPTSPSTTTRSAPAAGASSSPAGRPTSPARTRALDRTRARSTRPRRAAAAPTRGTCRSSFSPIAITYNLPGVDRLSPRRPDRSRRSSTASITKWNDPAIAKLNPGTKLPAREITAVHRNDESGTTRQLPEVPRRGAPTARGARAPARRSTAGSARAPRATRAPRRRSSPRRLRSPTTSGPSRRLRASSRRRIVDLRRPDRGQDQHGAVGKTDRRRQGQGRGQRPGARHLVVLQADRGRGLPDRAGHLRDRLLEVRRRRRPARPSRRS